MKDLMEGGVVNGMIWPLAEATDAVLTVLHSLVMVRRDPVAMKE
jgi:hypothetical protein